MNFFGKIMILGTVALAGGVSGENKFLNFDDLAPTMTKPTLTPTMSKTVSVRSSIITSISATGFTLKNGQSTTCALITKSNGDIVRGPKQTTTCSTVSKINSSTIVSTMKSTTKILPTSVSMSKLSSLSSVNASKTSVSSRGAKPTTTTTSQQVKGESLDELIFDVFGSKSSPYYSQKPVFFKDSSGIKTVHRRVYGPSDKALPFVSIDFKDAEAKMDCRCRCLL